ncbi:MAG: BamA/TamA family outer membrane protein [Planctomycetota bacterium]|nr:BamA/TamA family outer membrane protein [Planctomycetota bacterium]
MILSRTSGHRAWQFGRSSAIYLLGSAVFLLSCGCQSLPYGKSVATARGQSPGNVPYENEFSEFRPTGLPVRQGPDGPESYSEDASQDAQLADNTLVDIRVQGNDTIETAAIMAHVKSQVGRPPDERQIKEDLRSLYATKWFFSVERRYRMTDAGLVLMYRVLERPVVRSVVIKGNHNFSRRQILKQINIEPSSPFDVSTNVAAARKIEQYYHEKKSYPHAVVTLEVGGDPDDRDVVFSIEEGPYAVIRDTQFVGNTIRDGVLRTKLKSKRTVFGWLANYSPFGALFGGKYNEATIPQDIASLKEYYHNLGYFDVEIQRSIKRTNSHYVPQFKLVRNPGETSKFEHLPLPYIHFRRAEGATFVYSLTEGERFRLRNIEMEGNEIFSQDELLVDSGLKEGDYFNARFLNKDVSSMRERYGELGRLFAQVNAVPRFIDGQPGVVDLVYQVDEDKPYTIRKINVVINAPGGNPHTRETVVRNKVLVAPGDLADPNLIDKSKGRLRGQVFEGGGAGAPQIKISKVEEESLLAGVVTRGQSPFDSQPVPYSPLFENSNPGDPYGGLGNPYSRALQQPGQADLDIFVTEAQTGRLMFGVGVNSNAGVVGSFVLEENNFDITRFPTSMSDFWNGEAFRGNGERFRIEAVPGQITSRYSASWQTGNFLDTNFSFGVSGFYYQRFMPDWNEDRVGGRFSLGYQLDKWWSVTGAFRLEDVGLSSPNGGVANAPPLLLKSLGDNTLSTFRLSAAHDTRDSAFLPTNGHMLEASFEVGFGDYNYPRYELSATQHLTVYERPDGDGRHIVTFNGQLGYTGNDTPIFERFYAGGYQSFRGFAFRGISPQQTTDGRFVDEKSTGLSSSPIGVGGNTMAIGSVQYSVPLTADEMIRAVVFTDFGTIENATDLEHFRMTAGFGMRLTIPAMGPAPLAFDFGFPIVSDDLDDEQIFTFSVGLSR